MTQTNTEYKKLYRNRLLFLILVGTLIAFTIFYLPGTKQRRIIQWANQHFDAQVTYASEAKPTDDFVPPEPPSQWLVTAFGRDHFERVDSLYLYDGNAKTIGQVGSLTSMRAFGLMNSQVESVKGISQLSRLTHFSIDRCLVSDLNELGSIPSLQNVDISACPINNLQWLEKLSTLKWLNLGRLPAKDISPLYQQKSLEFLAIVEMDTLVDFRQLSQHKQLTYIGIDEAKVTSRESIELFCKEHPKCTVQISNCTDENGVVVNLLREAKVEE